MTLINSLLIVNGLYVAFLLYFIIIFRFAVESIISVLLKSSISLKFDLYFLHFCNFGLQLQLHLYIILLINYALNSISALVAMRFYRDHTHTRSSQVTHPLSHSATLASFPHFHVTRLSHSSRSAPCHREGGEWPLVFIFRVLFLGLLPFRQMPSIREF